MMPIMAKNPGLKGISMAVNREKDRNGAMRVVVSRRWPDGPVPAILSKLNHCKKDLGAHRRVDRDGQLAAIKGGTHSEAQGRC